MSVPYQNLEHVSYKSGLLRSTLHLRLVKENLLLTVAYVGDAVNLESAILNGQDAWLTKWWQSVVEKYGQEVDTLNNMLDAIDDPVRYYQKSWFECVVANATEMVSQLPSDVSNKARPEFHIFMDKVQRVRDFLPKAWEHRTAANKNFIQNELVRSKSYFDSLEGKPLTQEQRLAIVTDEDSNLIIAAAGSGKTSVIVGKYRWLVDRGYQPAEEILVLAYANNAKDEMNDRIRKLQKSKKETAPRVSTFHSLGRSIVSEVEGKMPSVAKYAGDAKMMTRHVKDIISELMQQSEFSKIMRKWFQEHFAPYRSVHEFSSYDEYMAYLRVHEIRTLKGDLVRSFEECEIANFLYLNGVAYEYEGPYEYDTATEKRAQYKPDFYLPDADLYIEHLALTRRFITPKFINNKEYLEGLKWKRELHESRGTIMLETYSWWQTAGKLVEWLEQMLRAEGVKFSPIPPDQMFHKLEELHKVEPFAERMSEFINHFKEQGLRIEDLEGRIGRGDEGRRDYAFVAVFKQVFRVYEHMLQVAGEVDFNDMIGKAANYVESGKYICPYRCIMVDEFQDISAGRSRLLKALCDSNIDGRLQKCQMFAVGDDWQSIYRFAGSDITIMQHFSEIFGYTERRDLTVSFRCSQKIIDVSRIFILKNDSQIGKKTRPFSPRPENDIHIYFPKTQYSDNILERILARIVEHGEMQEERLSVLVLGRYRHQIPEKFENYRKKFRSLAIEYKTVHGSKGCEADYIVVLGMGSGSRGFPSQRQSDTSLNLVLPKPEKYPLAEERRLFYVALTRARRSVYLLSDYNTRSEFLVELIKENYGVNVFGMSQPNKAYCLGCKTGRMVLRQNKKEEEKLFWGCSNFPYCTRTETSCTECGRGMVTRKDDKFVCNNCSKTFECCPAHDCDGWLTLKQGKFGPFFGCIKYRNCPFKRELQQEERKMHESPKLQPPGTRDQ